MKTSLKVAQKSSTAFPFSEGFLQVVPDPLRTVLHHLGAPAPNTRGHQLRRAPRASLQHRDVPRSPTPTPGTGGNVRDPSPPFPP